MRYVSDSRGIGVDTGAEVVYLLRKHLYASGQSAHDLDDADEELLRGDLAALAEHSRLQDRGVRQEAGIAQELVALIPRLAHSASSRMLVAAHHLAFGR